MAPFVMFRCSYCLHRYPTSLLRRVSVLHHPSTNPSTYLSLCRAPIIRRIRQRLLRQGGLQVTRTLAGSVQTAKNGFFQRNSWRIVSFITRVNAWVRNRYRAGLLLAGCALVGSYLSQATRSRQSAECLTEPLAVDSQLTTESERMEILSMARELTFVQKLKLTLRCVYLSLLLSPALFLQAIAYLIGSASIEKAAARYIIFVLQIAGPAFIKLGQWASTRRDLFSENFCKTLSFLHTRCDPHSWSETTASLKESFGDDWDQRLVICDRNPIGSGCVAQVYQGYLKYPQGDGSKNDSLKGTVPIAVKVMHPGVVEAMDLDIRLMKYVASWADYLFRDLHWIALKECVDEFAISMRKQLDMETEASNLSKFKALMTNYDSIKFPTPLYPYVTKTVLVETYEAGDHISVFLSEPGGDLQKTLAKIGVEVLLDMMFVHNFVHGDLHPGNILVQNPSSDDPKLVLIDCGIATSLGPVDFEKLYKVFKAIVSDDGERVADLMLDGQSCQTLAEYRQDMRELVSDQIQHLNLNECQVGTLFSKLFNILIDHKVRIHSCYTSVMVAFMVIEGVARSLDPSMDIMVYARPCILNRAKLALKEQVLQTSSSIKRKCKWFS